MARKKNETPPVDPAVYDPSKGYDEQAPEYYKRLLPPQAAEATVDYDAVNGPNEPDVVVEGGAPGHTQDVQRNPYVSSLLAPPYPPHRPPPPRRKPPAPPRINPNALNERPTYGVFLQGTNAAAHTLVCLCDTIGRARKQCATLQSFPAYAGKPLVIQRVKTVEVYRP